MPFDRIRGWLGIGDKGVPLPQPETVEEKQAQRTASELIDSILSEVPVDHCYEKLPAESLRALTEQDVSVRKAALLIAYERMITSKPPLIAVNSDGYYRDQRGLQAITSALLRGHLPLRDAELCFLVHGCRRENFRLIHPPLSSVLGAVERYVQTSAISPALAAELRALRPTLKGWSGETRENRLHGERIDRLLGKSTSLSLDASEPWAQCLNARVEEAQGAKRFAWESLLTHASTAIQGKPTKQWLKAAKPLVEGVGPVVFAEVFREVVALVGKAKEGVVAQVQTAFAPDTATLICDRNADLLRGLVWCCSFVSDSTLARTLGDLGQVCFTKVKNHGPRCAKVGNACIYLLSQMEDGEAIAQLSRLRVKVKHKSARAMVEKGITASARRSGMTSEDFEEASIPVYGMTEPGVGRQTVGAFTAEWRVGGADHAELRWITSAGKAQKAVPADVQREHPDVVKELKRRVRDLQQMLPAQRDRIERLVLNERSWKLRTWHERYLDHPFISTLARRLIWTFQRGDTSMLGAWLDGQLVDVENRPLTIDDETVVRLWHPIVSNAQTVLAWRMWLERQEITQPFKQAHRELYILTDAEERTGEYSNRFAGHILRQHQLAALCQARGWTYRLQGNFDSANYPELQLPRWEVRAEYFVEGNLQDTSEAGIYLYVSSDQVRFYPMTVNDPMQLRDVPPLLFTEVMRDVDLFVGVASVGNDPQWRDRGDVVGNYWHSVSFGELGATAQVRREVLERLIPRLKIASRCSFTDRFLVVRGEMRTYKIHLGSGNILMEPNDHYLCIVPGGTKDTVQRSNLFLPLEGDRTLAVILSKAFMLADDTHIKDPTITSQIGRR